MKNNLSAQDSMPPIQLDRPDQTECSYIVPQNHLQFESGYNFEKVNSDEKNFFYPSLLTKYGVNDKFELRLITEAATNQINNENVNGINPVKVGFKTKLLEENGIIPLTSFIGHLQIPYFSTKNKKATYYAPSYRFTMQHTLTDNLSLAYNLGTEWDGESAEPTFIYTLTSALSISEKTGAYIELYGFAPQKEKPDHRVDGGITFLAKKNIMLDLSGGFGLTENAPDYYTSFGFSIRLPN